MLNASCCEVCVRVLPVCNSKLSESSRQYVAAVTLFPCALADVNP